MPCEIQVDINIQHKAWQDVSGVIESVKNALEYGLLEKFQNSPIEISTVLADNRFVQHLNKTYRGKDKPTNVLSFPQDPQAHDKVINLGDIVFAYETVKEEAASQKKSFNDHFAHLFVHGVLHLLSFDHENDEEAVEMEALEVRILEKIGIKNPYQDIVE